MSILWQIKFEEFRLNCKYLHEYRESCIIGNRETWLGDYITNSIVEIDGFNLVRCDRTEELGKSRGGRGVAVYISEKWCKNSTIKKQLYSCHIELIGWISPFIYNLDLSLTQVCLNQI